ncbi:unnamed protein product [Menidia menidia]|uniref:(Atlantic silverside) hypothetical protein n=1 Tax=Menidia menidia TaxID=238744 RepID=A0A8S4ALT1_9TELE|nr:unnamed protein product [Menidia menidia]
MPSRHDTQPPRKPLRLIRAPAHHRQGASPPALTDTRLGLCSTAKDAVLQMVTSTGVSVRRDFESDTPQACHGFPSSHSLPSLGFPLSSNGLMGSCWSNVSRNYCHIWRYSRWGDTAYYCCKKNDSEVDVGSVAGADPLSHFPCNTCNALAMDGAAISPVSLDQLETGSHHNHCPTCSPRPLRPGPADNMRNGGERLGFHTYYDNPPVALPLSVNPPSSSPVSYYNPTDIFPPPPRPYSTDV